MVIGNQGQRSRNIARFADAHQRPGGQQLVKRRGLSGKKRYQRPDKQTAHNHLAAAEAIGKVARKRTESGIHPEEDGREQSELGVAHGNGLFDRDPHRCERQPIEIVQQCDHPEHGHHHPGTGEVLQFHDRHFLRELRWWKRTQSSPTVARL